MSNSLPYCKLRRPCYGWNMPPCNALNMPLWALPGLSLYVACSERGHNAEGTKVLIEVTVEAVRHRVTATVARTPFFNPSRKTATPPA